MNKLLLTLLLGTSIQLNASAFTGVQEEAIKNLTAAGILVGEEDGAEILAALNAHGVGTYNETCENFIADNTTSFTNENTRLLATGILNFKNRNGHDLTLVDRYDVSGTTLDCLFHCFSSVNPELISEDEKKPKTRKDFIDFLTLKIKENPTFKGIVQTSSQKDSEYQNHLKIFQVTAKDYPYLNYLSDHNDCIQLEPNINLIDGVEVEVNDSKDCGIPVALAYISNVNLRVWDCDKYYKQTSLKLDYIHPDATADTQTLNLFLYNGHYTILMFDEYGDDDDGQLNKALKLSSLEALQEHQWKITYNLLYPTDS